mmetsp:Transcript_48116/g.88136  ORF Transcript_48116/g.88136 Transcript_48116/m.88136 type:complete len:329 (+) Transcript_48116:75-1061(+)
MATRVFWCETDRELPSLCRGWRTPDPSPTRNAAGLPRYALTLCVETSSEEGDVSEPSTSTPRGRSTMTSSTRSTSRTPSPYLMHPHLSPQQICDKRGIDDKSVDGDMPTPRKEDSTPRGRSTTNSTRSTSRTPSPYLMHPHLSPQQICDKRGIDDKSVDGGMPTPRKEDSTPRGRSIAGSTRSTSRTPSPYLVHPHLSTQRIYNKFGMEDKSVDGDGRPTHRMQVPQPSLKSTQAAKVESDDGPTQKAPQVTSSKSDQAATVPKEQKPDAKGEYCMVVSMGTIGHPLSCAAPCKFARKSGGCKDGAACVRCHLCVWTRRCKNKGGASR